MKKQSKLFKRRAAENWGNDNSFHGKEDARAVQTVVNGIADQINGIKNTFKVKSETLAQFLAKNPITTLFTSEDPYIKDAGRKLQRMINGYVENSFEDSVKNRFKSKKGGNTVDWICSIFGQKTGTASTGLRMHPDYGEAGSYTTEANEENSKVGAPEVYPNNEIGGKHKCPDCGSLTQHTIHPDDVEAEARFYCPKCTKKHNRWPSVNGVGEAPHWPSWTKKESKQFKFKAKFLQK